MTDSEIINLACRLSGSRMREEMEPEEIIVNEGVEIVYIEKAQEVFNDYYDYYYNEIINFLNSK